MTGAYFVIYPLGRFVLEFFRGTERLRWGVLSLAQWVSLALAAAGVALLFAARGRPAGARNR